jgi:hypothetical protein
MLGFPDDEPHAQMLDHQVHASYSAIRRYRRPDGESMVPLLPSPDVSCPGLNQSAGKRVESRSAAGTARSDGVKQLLRVQPYLHYQHRDQAFCAGEAAGQRLVGAVLAHHVRELVAGDAPPHWLHSLAESVPCQHALTREEAATRLFANRFERPPVDRPWQRVGTVGRADNLPQFRPSGTSARDPY